MTVRIRYAMINPLVMIPLFPAGIIALFDINHLGLFTLPANPPPDVSRYLKKERLIILSLSMSRIIFGHLYVVNS